MNRRVCTNGGRLPMAMRRQGSVDYSSDQQTQNSAELVCPKCKDFFDTPLILPSCDHRVCKRCVEHMYERSSNRSFHCPERHCNKQCATKPAHIRADRDLGLRVTRYLQENSNRSGAQAMPESRLCQKQNCSTQAYGISPCPHCQLFLCQMHFEEDCESVKSTCSDQISKLERMLSELQECLDSSMLHKKNIESLREQNKLTYEKMKACLKKRFAEMEHELDQFCLKIDTLEKNINVNFKTFRKLQKAIKEALRVEEDDHETLKDKYILSSEAERLGKSFSMPTLTSDVRFNYTQADTEGIEDNIKKLRVLKSSLTFHVSSKMAIRCSDEGLRFAEERLKRKVKKLIPHQAVLWSDTTEFFMNKDQIVQRKSTAAATDTPEHTGTLPEEVLIVCDMIKLHVLSLDGEWLGQIRVADGADPFNAKYLSISPNGRQLCLLSYDKVVLCDMDGTVNAKIRLSAATTRRLQEVCSVTLANNNLMIVAAGNTLHHKPGEIFVLEGPDFDLHQAKRIPLDSRRIYPTGITEVRGSFIVLANQISVDERTEVEFNELLIYDKKSCEFIAELPCSQEIKSALYICSDDIGRVFVSVSRNRSGADARSSSDPPAEVIVLDPLGHQIGSIGAEDGLAMCSGISISDSRARTGRPNRLVVCDATQRLVLVYTLGSVR